MTQNKKVKKTVAEQSDLNNSTAVYFRLGGDIIAYIL